MPRPDCPKRKAARPYMSLLAANVLIEREPWHHVLPIFLVLSLSHANDLVIGLEAWGCKLQGLLVLCHCCKYNIASALDFWRCTAQGQSIQLHNCEEKLMTGAAACQILLAQSCLQD